MAPGSRRARGAARGGGGDDEPHEGGEGWRWRSPSGGAPAALAETRRTRRAVPVRPGEHLPRLRPEDGAGRLAAGERERRRAGGAGGGVVAEGASPRVPNPASSPPFAPLRCLNDTFLTPCPPCVAPSRQPLPSLGLRPRRDRESPDAAAGRHAVAPPRGCGRIPLRAGRGDDLDDAGDRASAPGSRAAAASPESRRSLAAGRSGAHLSGDRGLGRAVTAGEAGTHPTRRGLGPRSWRRRPRWSSSETFAERRRPAATRCSSALRLATEGWRRLSALGGETAASVGASR
jgi:hypothetical protein